MFAINTTSTMKYIKPLFLLASSWAIIPPYDFENYKIIYGSKYKTLRSFVIFYLIVGFIYAFVEKILYIQPLLHGTVVVVDYLAFISYFLINILTVFSTNFYNFDNLKKMLDILANTDKTLKRYHEDNAKSNKTYIKIELFASFAILSCAMVFDYVLWSRAASVAIIQFSTVYSNTQRIQTHITMHVVCNFIACIRRGYRDANNLLVDVVTKKGIIKLMDKFTVNKFKLDYTVKDVIRIYIGLNKMIDCINKLYGWTLLCLNINIISTLLLSFDFIIEYTADTNVLREKNGISFIFLMLVWSMLSLIVGILLANLAHSTSLEIQNTSRLSYKLLQQVPYDTKTNPYTQEMREDLMLLSEQMSSRMPTFSAAGFFSIDYTMLFTLLSSITSYLVVLIQFN